MSETIFSSTFGAADASSVRAGCYKLGLGRMAVPAIVRGRNLNEKLNIAMIGVGGRGATQSEASCLRKHRGPLRRVRAVD